MVLKDYLFSVASIEGNVASVQLIQDNDIYKAHFPGMPITPGVCIIGMCREIAQMISGRGLRLKTVKDVKFQNLLVPGPDEPVRVEFTKLEENPGGMSAVVSVTRADVKIARLSLVFA